MTRARLDDEDGAVTLWMLMLAVFVLTMGALSVDLWQAVSVRSELAGRADAAVAAGASGVDVIVYREDGVVVLEPELARARTYAVLGEVALDENEDRPWAEVLIGEQDLRVILRAKVTPILLRLLNPEEPSIEVAVERRAFARLD